MNGIIKFSLSNKFAIWIMTIIVVVAGLLAGLSMKMETLPDINLPIVTVTTIYPGAAPEEIVEAVTAPLEQRTRNLDGVKSINSTSMENASSIIIEYDYSKDMSEALTEVREAAAAVNLPAGAQDSQISRLSINAFPVMSLSVSGAQSLAELTKFVQEIAVPTLEGLPGVATVDIAGQHLEQVELRFDHAKMAELGISEDTVKGLIQGNALKLPLGLFEFGQTEKAVVVDGNIVTLDDLRNLSIPVIPAAGGMQGPPGQMGDPAAEPDPALLALLSSQTLPTVKLSEVASVELIGKAESLSRTNGEDSIGITIVKAADANTVEVVNLVKEEMKQLEENYEGITLTAIFDQGKPIEDSVHTMLNKAMLGSLFAILIIMLFLRNFRSTLIAVVSIPLSILIALLLLNQMDITLNIMTLGAMTVAIGRVVDDSIVVIENIYRRMSLSTEKLKGRELMHAATREMFKPIMSSTIVTIAVFLPLGLVTGPVGEMFLPFALTIVFALLASLLVAITVVPMLAHMFFRNGLKPDKQHDKQGAMSQFYKSVLRWSLDRKWMTFGLAVLLLAGSMMLVVTGAVGFSYIPSEEEKIMMVTYNPAPGERLDDVKQLTAEAESLFMDRSGVDTLQYSVGGANPMNPGASRQALFFVNYDPKTEKFDEEKTNVVAKLNELGGRGEWKEQDFTGGAMGGSQINMLVYGPDLAAIKPVVDQVTDIMRRHDGLSQVDTSIADTYEQYRIVADSAKLAQYGLAAGQIAMELMPVRQQAALTTIQNDGEDVQVFIAADAFEYGDRADLENRVITSPLGFPVPLKDIASIVEEESSDTVTRKDGRVYASVTADATVSDIGKLSSTLQKEVDLLELPANVEITMGGVTEQMNESFRQLGLAMLAAVAIVYLILVITFGGGLTPFAILFSLPFTVIGALVGLFLAGETVSITALIGALMLIGIVVTNAIVLIDRVIQKEKEGLSVREALLEAAGTRLRPILMTALATIGALLPLAFGFESGGLISKGLGVTVIGGLTSSTLLTLIIVPVVYEMLHKFRRKRQEQ